MYVGPLLATFETKKHKTKDYDLIVLGPNQRMYTNRTLLSLLLSALMTVSVYANTCATAFTTKAGGHNRHMQIS